MCPNFMVNLVLGPKVGEPVPGDAVEVRVLGVDVEKGRNKLCVGTRSRALSIFNAYGDPIVTRQKAAGSKVE